MLQNILFLFGLIGFALVVIWAVSNDAPGNAGGFRGLLAMKDGSGRSKPKRQDHS